jgi:hypothetical protein
LTIGEVRRIFWKGVVGFEKETGWDERIKGRSWTDAELRVVLSDAPILDNCVETCPGVWSLLWLYQTNIQTHITNDGGEILSGLCSRNLFREHNVSIRN